MVQQGTPNAKRTSWANPWRLLSGCETEKERKGNRRLKMKKTKGKALLNPEVTKSSDSAALNNVTKANVLEFFSLVTTKLASLAR